ncbi:hypothetical protein [Metabacillus indicus]|uniref:Uncharacterized protein n=1 Tax=Metabacillus indicus TaxID=246786 RepID=A0A084GIL0_METID|nr:hypothetical protein [Metabacillus indicus]KEZ47172.1 hypothetical protein GS18_0220185 [Metabacillus indicus]
MAKKGRRGNSCILYKDGKEIGTFDSITEAAIYLESKIGGSLYPGIYGLCDGWVPPENSQLYGYSAKRIK